MLTLGSPPPASLFGICQKSYISGWIGGLCQARKEIGKEMRREGEGFSDTAQLEFIGFHDLGVQRNV